jgi:hypothetical protein
VNKLNLVQILIYCSVLINVAEIYIVDNDISRNISVIHMSNGEHVDIIETPEEIYRMIQNTK